MHDVRLDGMRVLVMEDEFLIAMDVEQLCREHGAAEVTIIRHIEEFGSGLWDGEPFHVAILDVMLGGNPTTEIARQLFDRGIPFVFATGYTDIQEHFDAAAEVEVVGKPYAGRELIAAVGRAMARLREASGGV